MLREFNSLYLINGKTDYPIFLTNDLQLQTLNFLKVKGDIPDVYPEVAKIVEVKIDSFLIFDDFR